MIVEEKDVDRICKEIEDADVVALDFETVSLEDKTAVAFSLAYGNKVYFVPIKMKYFINLPFKSYLKLLITLVHHSDLIFHNTAFDLQVLDKIGVSVRHPPHDTLILSHLINENGSHKLKDLVKEYLDYDMIRYKEVCGTGKKQIEFRDVTDKALAEKYASDDAKQTLELFRLLYPKVRNDKGLAQAYDEVERPLLLVVNDMHLHGVPINKEKIDVIRTKCDKFKDFYKGKLDIYMSGVNLNSPKQLREYFVDNKHLPILKRSRKTNEPSVDSEVLEKYADKHNCMEADWILKYRYYSKILTTFVPALTPDESGKIHSHFHQVGTTSGRFSSSEPNFQNIPAKDEFDIRDSIEAPEGYTLVGADYSQMELRLAAHFSKDKRMCKLFNDDYDIHKETADKVGCDRRQAKVLNFGLLYGMGVRTLAKTLECSGQEAQEYLHNYYQTYPQLQLWLRQKRQDAISQGYLQLLYGRKRHIPPNFDDQTDWKKGGILRSMVNSIIQGSGAMIIKKAMVLMHKDLKEFNAVVLAQIHDEVIVICKEENAKKVKKIVVDSMIKPTQNLRVSFKVDSKMGQTWQAIHE